MREVSVYTDNEAAITATGTDTPGSARHIVEMVHALHHRLTTKHSRAQVTIRWIPSHSDICGNEKADEHAKRAAKGDVSPPEKSPCMSTEGPLHQQGSSTTHVQAKAHRSSSAHVESVTEIPQTPADRPSPLHRELPKKPKCQSAVLVQLRTGHIVCPLVSELVHPALCCGNVDVFG